jgi:hypothetical protein
MLRFGEKVPFAVFALFCSDLVEKYLSPFLLLVCDDIVALEALGLTSHKW